MSDGSIAAPVIVGLTGLAGSGKSTIARELVTVHRAVPCSFATWFKVPAVAWGAPIREVFGPEPKSPDTRHALQVMGTEEGRDKHGEDFWIRHAEADLYRLARAGVELVVYDDVRFPNECDWILGLGGHVFRLMRDGAGLTGDAALHPSEAHIGDLKAVNIDNNRPADEVRRVIASLLWPEDRFNR